MTLVDGGAPTGNSPGAAANLDGGHFRVPGIDMNSQIRDAGDGSYTMTAWIKPSATDGERFIFGQTNQGIHHGIRNGGFLHSAHWGADWNASTKVQDHTPAEAQDGWMHAAFVYDGAADKGKIYLDGVLDGENSQRAPNGGGHFIFGGRNNGEAQYRGLIDEVAVWTEALASAEVAGLAAGGSPIASLGDEDGDGFVDAWEQKYAGNLTSLGGGDRDANLLAYLDFNNQLDDQSGNGLNGTLNGPAALSADQEGFSSAEGDYSINLGGNNDKSAVLIESATLASAVANNTMAVSFWQNITQIGNNSSFWIHSPTAGANDRGFQAHVPWGNGTIFFDQSGCCGGPQRLTVGGKVVINEWQHFVFQRDAAGTMQIWVNGEKSAEQGGAEALEAFTKITIGAEGNNLNNSMAGRLDEFSVWDRMLTSEEIATLSGGAATTEILNIAPADADGDGLTDAEEYASQASNPVKADSDDDGLTDAEEIAAGTQPLVADTDGDGLLDGAEFASSYEIANSINDFTTDGTQGTNGWVSGYRNYTADGGGDDYNATEDFITFDKEAAWRGDFWRLAPSGAPWTLVKSDSGHPNGTNSAPNEEHWAMRRWTSDRDATLSVEWKLSEQNQGGSGVGGSLHHNGVLVDSGATDTGEGFTKTKVITVSENDVIDLALTPVGPNGDRSDGSDGSFFSMTISSGTNALVADTDGDGYNDGVEARVGSNPTDAESIPSSLVAYYNFERSSGNSVADQGTWGNTGTVTRPDQTTLGVSGGAPAGPSPATAADLQDGLINVPGVDLSNVIGGEGSYTFTAWINPSDLGGDKFLFGQTSQGIHNGIRNNGFLHQAHWGADTNGATNLNDYLAADEDKWVHAAWTYDGATNTGKIYLDGVEDYSGGKRAAERKRKP